VLFICLTSIVDLIVICRTFCLPIIYKSFKTCSLYHKPKLQLLFDKGKIPLISDNFLLIFVLKF